mgnify:FL=1
MELKIQNKSKHPLPKFSTLGSAGLDIRANISEPILLKPMQRKLITTGLFLEIPNGFEAQIRPRSGLSLKNGITVLNSPGTIDSDYRGEVGIILINLSLEDFLINDGDRVAQMVIAKHEQPLLSEIEIIENTDRGVLGFGSTGKN